MKLARAVVRTAWFLLTFGAATLVGGCAHVPPAPPGALPGAPRLYLVAPGIYRSGQPSAEQFRDLVARYGIKSVLKLNSAIEGHDVLPAGVDLFHDMLLPAGPVDHEDLEQLLTDLELAPKPVLIHCSHGVDRTGLVVALWRVRHGTLPFAAWGEWRAYGRDMNLALFSEAFERETGWRR